VISRAEILATAGDLSLAPEVVEKDYVLGWLLAGIYAHEALTPAWAFKGGTCLKKCYFETYRFSEDLDFTITDAVHLDAGFLKAAFADVSAWLYDATGLIVPADRCRFDVRLNPRGGLSCEGRIYYEGPLRGGRSSLPRIKLDLTVDEVLVMAPVERPVGHPYSDLPEGGITARCYAYEEVFGEKVRALAERTRPRDLYDVVNLFRHDEFRPAATAVLGVLREKCRFKGISVPTFATLAGTTGELLADWKAMLAHQLPILPPFEAFWEALPGFFAWLESGLEPEVLPPAPVLPGSEGELFRPAVGFLRQQNIAGSSYLEAIRFAGVNRLCVDLDYTDKKGKRSTRRIEPYSLRRSRAGDILVYALRSDNGEVRAYLLHAINGARVTDQTFVPRYAVELTAGEIGAIPPTSREAVFSAPAARAYWPPARTARPHHGPTYVYKCTVCGKAFRRTKADAHLNPHKTEQGWPCPGRIGYLIGTKH